MDYYILDDDRRAVPATSREWSDWFEKSGRDGSRIVGRWEHNGAEVSTVFLGIDHCFGGSPPMLFETMIFGGPHDGEQWRHSTWWREAEAFHMATCRTLARETRQATNNEEN